MKLQPRYYDVNVHAIFELMIPNIERAGVIVVVTVLSLNNARTKSKNELRCSSIFASSTPATTTHTDEGKKEETEEREKGERENGRKGKQASSNNHINNND